MIALLALGSALYLTPPIETASDSEWALAIALLTVGILSALANALRA